VGTIQHLASEGTFMEFWRRHVGLGVVLIAGLLLVGRIIWVHANRTVVRGYPPVKELEFW